MKNNIYVRSGMSPVNQPAIEDIITHNLIGRNVGNLVYAYSIYRTLMTSDDVEFMPNYYRYEPELIDYLNETGRYFIIPLADMFRLDAQDRLQKLTNIVKKLEIPCILAGVGLRAPLGVDINRPFPFDDTVRGFVDALLEKSDVIGIRGEITGKYLSRLGYKEDKHYMVIGCPSMYGFGGTLKRRELHLTKDSPISVNASNVSPQKTFDLLYKILQERPNSCFVPQMIDELWLIYGGRTLTQKKGLPVNYPRKMSDFLYQQDRVRFFLHARSWIDFLGGMDLSIGGRMHGNIAAILAGTPSVIFCHDSRMKELLEYHQLPHLTTDQIQENWSLEEILEQVDFAKMYQRHGENFQRYCTFLKRNGVHHIFEEKDFVEEAPLDRRLKTMELPQPVYSAVHLSTEELADRWHRIYEFREEFKNKQIKGLRKKHEERGKKLTQVRKKYKMLNEPSIKKDARILALEVKDKMTGTKRNNFDRAKYLSEKK